MVKSINGFINKYELGEFVFTNEDLLIKLRNIEICWIELTTWFGFNKSLTTWIEKCTDWSKHLEGDDLKSWFGAEEDNNEVFLAVFDMYEGKGRYVNAERVVKILIAYGRFDLADKVVNKYIK